MGFGIKKETLDDVFTVVGAVFIFNSLPSFQVIGKYFQQQPIWVFIIGISIIAFRKKIADAIGD